MLNGKNENVLDCLRDGVSCEFYDNSKGACPKISLFGRVLTLIGGIMANMKKGAAYISESERINDEVWLPSQIELNASIKVLLVRRININQVAKYSDYHKFETEVKDSKVGEIKKQ